VRRKFLTSFYSAIYCVYSSEKLRKLVDICQSYHKNKRLKRVSFFYGPQCSTALIYPSFITRLNIRLGVARILAVIYGCIRHAFRAPPGSPEQRSACFSCVPGTSQVQGTHNRTLARSLLEVTGSLRLSAQAPFSRWWRCCCTNCDMCDM